MPKDELNVDLEVQVLLEKPRSVPDAASENEEVLDYIQIRHTGADIINTGNIKFRLSKQDLYDLDIAPHGVVLKRLVKDTWVPLKTRGIGSDEMHQIFNSETPGFSYFAIVGARSFEEAPLIETPTVEEQIIEIEREAEDAKLVEIVDETDTFENWTALIVALIIALVVGVFVVVFVTTQKNDQKLINELEDAEHVEHFEEERISEGEALKNEVNANVQKAKELINQAKLREARQTIRKLQELSRKLEGVDREVVNSNILKLRKLMMKVIEESM